MSQLDRLAFQEINRNPLLRHQETVSDQHRLPVNKASGAHAGERFKVFCGRRRNAVLSRPINNRFCERMLRRFLQRGGHGKHLPPGKIRCADHIRCFRFTTRQRSGFVKYDHGNFMDLFKGLAAFDQDAALRAKARTHDDGRGRGQPQRAGAGDDQHRHKIKQSAAEIGVEGNKIPNTKRQKGNQKDNRHKNRRYFVRQALNRRLGTLRFFHHTDNMRQHGVRAYAGGAHREAS